MISSNLLENRPLLQIPLGIHTLENSCCTERKEKGQENTCCSFSDSQRVICASILFEPRIGTKRAILSIRGDQCNLPDNAYVKRSPLAVGSFLFPLPPSPCFRSFSPPFLPSFPRNKRNLTCENTRRDPFRGSTSFKGSPRIRTISQKFKTKWICLLPLSP